MTQKEAHDIQNTAKVGNQELGKNNPEFYGTRKFSTAFTRVGICPYPERDLSSIRSLASGKRLIDVFSEPSVRKPAVPGVYVTSRIFLLTFCDGTSVRQAGQHAYCHYPPPFTLSHSATQHYHML
jgi:hypothetical protein